MEEFSDVRFNSVLLLNFLTAE